MWKVLLVIILLTLVYWFLVNKRKQKPSKDRTGDLLVVEHLKDVYNNDNLDDEVGRMLRLN